MLMACPGMAPSVVLICHEDEPIDSVGIAAWLACRFTLSGMVVLRERAGSQWRKLRREYRRVGWLRMLDVILFQLYYRLRQARKDARWKAEQASALRARFPAELDPIPRLVAHHPNEAGVKTFISSLYPDIVIVRCKQLLMPEIFTIPRCGTVVLCTCRPATPSTKRANRTS
jgi:hypothetical protein